MRKPGCVLRILCGVVDFLLIMIPIQFILLGVFSVSLRQADLLFKLLFAVYGALLTEYMGMTAGKYFGKLRVADNRGGKAPILYVGLRELTKSLYLIPWLGWGLALVSLAMMAVRRDGRTLHDLVGSTRVMTARRFEQEERERIYEWND